ncbi:PepSY domain-containing protein [Oceanobacillus chungangensis]|uniref:PepSY domain-containing protein n=1 Tax=Oceanobacillus chungangensis TaxID=1229152 RepID=A0A3D8PG55_9BACI|nr:PepSY domain-containing protein [Oceanobacillus chungangensis]RDW15070.1 hypothetical protein CWR45_18815 [Oceanobacillus chungangensis]
MKKTIGFVIATFICIGLFVFGPSQTSASIANPENGEKISLLEAEHIALQEFTGIVKQHQLTWVDNCQTYEVEITNRNQEAKIEVDAFTGEIINLDITQN